MKTILLTIVLLILTSSVLVGQTIIHPWHVVDRGGGKSTSGGINLHSSIGQTAIQASASGGINLEPGYLPGVRQLGGVLTTLEYGTEDTWNMVSVPLIMSDYLKTTLYPTANSVAFAYTGSYQQRDTLRNLIGYWVKFPALKTVEFTGTAITKDSVNVNTSWNLIGCLSYPVKTSGIVPIGTTVTSSYFGYSGISGYYTEDTLKPSRAYWVKTSSAGQLEMTTGSVMIAPSVSSAIVTKPKMDREPEESFSSLTIKDAQGRERTLKFTSGSTDLDLTKYELPPIPPTFDVRYISNRALETAEPGKTKDVALRISSADYPLSISWKSYAEASLIVGKDITALKGEGTMQIKDAELSIKLRLAPSQGQELPKQFALHQNYPNPFNPVTTIRYDLPIASRVTLIIYNLLGQEVTTLIDEQQEAGYKTVKWDAVSISSGLYYYRLVAGDYTAVEKMMVVK